MFFVFLLGSPQTCVDGDRASELLCGSDPGEVVGGGGFWYVSSS